MASNSAHTMRSAMWKGPDKLEIQTVPVPEPQKGEALVQIEYTGLCGTDFSILHGSHPRAVPPLIMGHEITGVVVTAAGTGPAAGTRVAVEPLIHCGQCLPCSRGNTHVCRNLKLFGIDAPGSLAEYVALPADKLLPISQSVPVKEAALAEPLAVAVHAVSRSGLSGGEQVMIFGAGPIGILTALVARNAGAQNILIAERSDDRRRVAEALDFNTVPAGGDPVESILAETGGDGADIVFDSAGHPAVAALLPQAIRVHGTVVLVGVYKYPAEVDLQALTFAENTVVGVRVYTRDDFKKAVELLESDALQLGRLPTEVFPLEETAHAFEKAMAASGTLKVLVTPGTALNGDDPTSEQNGSINVTEPF